MTDKADTKEIKTDKFEKLKARKKVRPEKPEGREIGEEEIPERQVPTGFILKACPGTPKLVFKFNSDTGELI
jgi:hypothetical protein